jgi:3-oxoadipate enol-lactonase
MTVQVKTGYAEVNGTRLAYDEAGEGHPFVMIHGGLVDRHLWDDQFEVFAQHYRVIRYDIRAFGESAMPTEPFSMIEDLYQLMKFLNIEKTYLMGLSMGGALAIDFTVAHPEMIDALIPVASGVNGFEPPNTPETQQMMAEWETIGKQIETLLDKGRFDEAIEIENRLWTDGPNRTPEQVNPNVRKRVHDMELHNYQEQAKAGNGELPEPTEPEKPAFAHQSEIHVPTLIIVGDADVVAILFQAQILESGIAGAKKAIIPNTAHHLNMEEPEKFNNIVLDFLEGLS